VRAAERADRADQLVAEFARFGPLAHRQRGRGPATTAKMFLIRCDSSLARQVAALGQLVRLVDVDRGAEPARRAPVRPLHRHRAGHHPAVLAVVAADAVLDFVGLAALQAFLPAAVGVHEVVGVYRPPSSCELLPVNASSWWLK
jgi:hypothetical protein